MVYSPWILPLWGLLLTPQLVAAKQCYLMDGTVAASNMIPCDPAADVSACCTPSDVCMSSGLCFSQVSGYSGLVFADGCTLQSGQDPACPQSNFCSNLGVTFPTWNVLQCEPNVFCCRAHSDPANCCGNVTAVVTRSIGTLSVTMATLVSSSSATATGLQSYFASISPGTITKSTNDSPTVTAASGETTCPADNSALVGGSVGGILGLGLLGTMGAIVYLVQQTKRLAAGGARGPVAEGEAVAGGGPGRGSGGGPGGEPEGRGAFEPMKSTGYYSQVTMDTSDKVAPGFAETPGKGPGGKLEGTGAFEPMKPTGFYSQVAVDASDNGTSGLAEAPVRSANPTLYHKAAAEMAA